MTLTPPEQDHDGWWTVAILNGWVRIAVVMDTNRGRAMARAREMMAT